MATDQQQDGFINEHHRTAYEAIRKAANESFAYVAEADGFKQFHQRIHNVIMKQLGGVSKLKPSNDTGRSVLITLAVCYIEGYFHGQFEAGEGAPFPTVRAKVLDYVSDGLSLLVRGVKDPDGVTGEIMDKLTPEQRAEAEAMLAAALKRRAATAEGE